MPAIIITAIFHLALMFWMVPAPSARGGVQIDQILPSPERVSLDWLGGHGPYSVEISPDLVHWSAYGEPTTARQSSLPAFAETSYYRVQDLDPAATSGELFGLIQTQQSEFGSIMGLHRLKSRLWLYRTKEAPHTSSSFTAAAYWRKLRVHYQYLDGSQVVVWSGAFEDLGTIATPTSQKMTISWSRGSGSELRSYVLTLDFPYSHNTIRNNPPFASDPYYTLQCSYARPQPQFDAFTGLIGSTRSDSISLIELSPYNPADPQPPFTTRRYSVEKKGASLNFHFFEGLPLYQGEIPWILKTYPFDRWLSPTTGYGASLPAFTTDSYFARTVQPGHHNFYENILIEPALDPTTSEKTRAALTAANIRQIFTYKDLAGVSWDGKTQDILYIGFDNTVHFP
jgi:hypothetical protein